MLFDIYKISPSFGIHGHMFFTESAGEVELFGENNYVLLPPGQNFILSCLSFNLAAMQGFIMIFLSEHGHVFLDAEDPAIIRNAKQLAQDVSALEISWEFRDRAR